MSDEAVRRGRIKLLLLGLLFTAPMAAAYLLYYFGPPVRETVNYGELIAPVALPDAPLARLDGEPFRLSQLRGKWVMLQVDSGRCTEACQRKLYAMRQVRKTQGREMQRIERVWLIDDSAPPDARILADYEGTWLVTNGSGAVARLLPAAGSPRDHIYLIDPLGNLMLRFPKDADPRRMVNDIGRLLKVSRVG
jgi:hypothetical protein